jgi:hypothetical protein
MRSSPSRIAALVVVAAALSASGCGGRASGPGSAPPAVPAAAEAYGAARWIPARPTYALLARSMADAQRAATGLVGALGALTHASPAAASDLLWRLLGVDALSADAVAEIGVDLEAGVALFSEAVNPTVVVRLSAPAQTLAFIDRQRAAGMQTQSVMADGVEVFSVALPGGPKIWWAIAEDWLWIHFALPGAPDEGTAWFSSSRRPGAPAWGGDFASATSSGRPAVAGFVDVRALFARLSPRIPAAMACARLLDPVGRLAVSMDAGAERLDGRLALELGGAAAGLQRAVLPAPGAWSAAAAGAPVAAQWNLDLGWVGERIAPCAGALGVDLAALARYGVRTARAILQHYDPGQPTKSRGAVSFDLMHRTYAAQLLDEIPGRSLIQRRRTFGPYQGYALSIPFGPTVEYVLDDQRALAGLGEGVLAAVVGQGPGAPGPLFALDVAPPAMPREAWAGLLAQVGLTVGPLLAWRELHLAAAIDGTRLVIDAAGRRR